MAEENNQIEDAGEIEFPPHDTISEMADSERQLVDARSETLGRHRKNISTRIRDSKIAHTRVYDAAPRMRKRVRVFFFRSAEN